jgi:hypothetical protein
MVSLGRFSPRSIDMRKNILLIFMTMACLAAPASNAFAQTDPVVTAPKNGGKAQTLVGSWLETVTFPPETGRPPLKSLVTFHGDGTMTCSDQGSVTLIEPSVFTACHGAWTHLEKRDFAYTQLELVSDLSGNLIGYLKVRGIYTVSGSGHQYTGTSVAQIFDTAGTVLFEVQVDNIGNRIVVELP